MPFCVAVADGVGGNAGGADAAQFVCEELQTIEFAEIKYIDRLRTKIESINDKLIMFSRNQNGCEKMATTLTGIICTADGAAIYHVGNTRIHIAQGNYLKQLTEDNTTFQWLIKAGNIDGAMNCNKSELLSCMGGGNSRFIEGLSVLPVKLTDKFKLIITSDGVHDFVSIDDLEKSVCEREVTEATCNEIFQLALKKGSTDDSTIMILEV